MRRVRLKSLSTNGGFLEQCRVEFAPTLTCIIGARGTCKSTIVESIRYAFGADAERVKELTDRTGMLRKTLGSASVRCVLEVESDGQLAEYTIDREMDDDPRVSRNGVRDASADAILRDLEVYSQGALQEIASTDKPRLRLQLIDRPHRDEVVRLEAEILARTTELKAVGSRLRVLRGEIERREVEVRDVAQLKAELGKTVDERPPLPPTLEEQHILFVQRRHLLDILNEASAIQSHVLDSLGVVGSSPVRVESLVGRLDQFALPDTKSAQRLLSELQDTLGNILSVERQIAAVPITKQVAVLTAKFDEENQLYRELRQQQQELNESLKHEDAVRNRLLELEKLDRELQRFSQERQDLDTRRRTLRTELTLLRDQIFEMRVKEADSINREFGSVVLLSVQRGTHSKPFIEKVSDLLSGSRIRTQGNIAEELATNLSASDLLEIVEDGDAQRLAKLLNRDLGQVTRFITFLRDHPELYDLEGNLFEDTLDITMFDRGQPKPVEQLSEGQRATALLPLILRSSSCPLLIDQPEDDLDNSFIFQVLVKNILRLKINRQLIFVTHNANIPVLGDAEQIVVMHMDRPTKAGVPQMGSLEQRKSDVLQILEGGKEAFAYREQQYRSLL